MEGDDDTQRPEGRENQDWTHRRNWTRRLTGIKYERFSALNADGVPRIFFKFDDDRLHDSAYAIMKEHQTREDGYPTGLKYSHDRIHGKTWNLADHEHGRSTADRLDRKLRDLAHKLEREQGQGHDR